MIDAKKSFIYFLILLKVEILEQEQRRALGRLRGEGKHGKVNSIRIGGALTASGPGVHRPENHIERKALKPCNSGM